MVRMRCSKSLLLLDKTVEKLIENIECNTQIAKVTIHRVFDRPGIAAEVFGALGQHGLNVEAISTNPLGRGRANISFAVLESALEDVHRVLESIKVRFGAKTITVDKDQAIITIYGTKLSTTPGIAGRIFSKLSELGINIEMISGSLSFLSMVIKRSKALEAMEVIKAEFSI